MTGADPRTEDPGEPEHTDALACVSAGLYAYLLEIDGYRAICSRHQGTAVIVARSEVLRVVRFFESRSGAVAHLTTALMQLSHWPEHGPAAAIHPGRSFPVEGEFVWENRQLGIRTRRLRAGLLVGVELTAPPWDGDLLELPLRRLANVLRCHEFLIPEIKHPAAAPPAGEDGFLGIREYLKRTMPPNLVASQCI